MVATILILVAPVAIGLLLSILAELVPAVGDYPSNCTPFEGKAQQWHKTRQPRHQPDLAPPPPVLGVDYLAAVNGTTPELEQEYMDGVKTPLDGVPDSDSQTARQLTESYHQGLPVVTDRQLKPLSDKTDSPPTDSPTGGTLMAWQIGADGQHLVPVAPTQEASSHTLWGLFKSRFVKK